MGARVCPGGRRSGHSRVCSPCVGAVATGTASLVVVSQSALHFAYENLALHVALESAESVVALLLAYVWLSRAAPGARRLGAAFALLALTNLVFAVGPILLYGDRPVGSVLVVGAMVRFLAVVLFLTGVSLVARPTVRINQLAVGGAAVTLLAIVPSIFPIEVTRGDPARLLSGQAVADVGAMLALHSAGAVVSAAAAWMLIRERGSADEPWKRWLTAGTILLTFSKVHYMFFPSLYTAYVFSGDVVRFLAYLAFLASGVHVFAGAQRARTELAIKDVERRVAGDLHDGVIQELHYIRLLSEGLGAADAGAARVCQGADRALLHLRRVVGELDGAGPRGEIGAELRALATEVMQAAGPDLRLEIDDALSVGRIEQDAVLLIAREALSNAMRHARPTTVAVRLDLHDAALRLRVDDDGRGFDVTEPNAGMGLHSIRRRTRAVGGSMELRSRPGTGTSIVVLVPLITTSPRAPNPALARR